MRPTKRVSSTAKDGDFIATIQDVAPDGTAASYNVHGQLRASLRKLQDAPCKNLGLPWHGFYEADVAPLAPGQAGRTGIRAIAHIDDFQGRSPRAAGDCFRGPDDAQARYRRL